MSIVFVLDCKIQIMHFDILTSLHMLINGFATVEDACGGCTGQPWIDLGYSDDDYEAWHSWVTVYFLTPVPQNVVYVLE